MFLSSRRVKKFGLTARLLMTLSIVIASILLFILPKPLDRLAISVSSILILELLILWIGGGLKKVLSGFIVILIFIFIGFLITLFSIFLGFVPPPLDYATISMFRMVILVLSFATAIQFFTVEEIRWLLTRLGLRDVSVVVALTLSQLPLTYIQFSEAITTVKLKLGERNLYKVVKPLVVYSVMNSLNLAEALYIHGVYEPIKPRFLCGKKDSILIAVSIAVLVLVLLF
ncbi:MAG: hypothetical protein LM568_02720 [Desulfurococcaceae archaeon]|nr:hypothetical protein [Desulfurococcaceae archaeon]